MSKTEVIIWITNLPIVIITGCAIKYYKHLKRELRLFSKFLFLSFIIQISSAFFAHKSINNMPFLHAYTAMGGFILIYFYREILSLYLDKKILQWTAWIYFLVIAFDSLFFESIFTFNRIALIIEAITIIILSTSTFALFLQERSAFLNEQKVKTIGWINSGLFVYFSTNLLLYYFGEYLMQDPSIDYSIFREVWMLHSLATIATYACFIIGLWKSQAK